MANKVILRKLGQTDRDKEKRQEEARKEVREIKQALVEERQEADAERDLPEHDGLVTKHHLRHARRVQSSGRRLGETVDRLPIHAGDKPYHQEGHRKPKTVEFEGTLDKLIEKYGPYDADEHFSLGQHQKYEKKINRKGQVEYWNIRTGEREYPIETPAERLKHQVRHSLRDLE